MRFTKMHGIGNDYVYINGFKEHVEDPPALARLVSDRHRGIGSDGLILVLPSRRADFRMRMFNADGSEAEMCGNGARCVGRFVFEQGLTNQTRFALETGGGIRPIELHLDGGKVRSVTVDMGAPQRLERREGYTFVSMGNPHAVYFMNADPFQWPRFEAEGEKRCRQMGANIEFVQALSPREMRMRVYERGSAETLACGTGACASAVAAVDAGLCQRRCRVSLRGGPLEIEWREGDGHVLMTGEAVTVFEGEWPQGESGNSTGIRD